MPVRFRNCTVIKTIIRTVCVICSNWQFYYQKNVRPNSIVKFEFLGYNVYVCAYGKCEYGTRTSSSSIVTC